jgi:hypothetical protein
MSHFFFGETACKVGALQLESNLSPFFSCYFGEGVSRTICGPPIQTVCMIDQELECLPGFC